MSEPKRITDPAEREDQLTTAPGAEPEDAAERIELSEGADGATRIDWTEAAAVRPGDPGAERH